MKISIAQRYMPFSHLAGIKCLLPGTPFRLQIFPTLIKVDDLSGFEARSAGDLKLALEGPLKDFTVQADLEKGFILVSGDSPQGYFRYRIALSMEGLQLIPEKGTLEKQTLSLKGMQMRTPPSTERLALGSHKAQNWSMVQQRDDLLEILPIWMKLGQMTPNSIEELVKGPSLLSQCENPDDPYTAFLNLWKAGFEGILSPRPIDDQYQGFPFPPVPPKESPLRILTQGAALIRKLFIVRNSNVIAILPNVPSQFHSGRMIGINAGSYGNIDMEWSKKQMRRLIFKGSEIGQIRFLFQKQLKTMRLSSQTHPKGVRIATSSAIDILPGERYLLDRFEH